MSNSRFNMDKYLTHIRLPDYQPELTLESLRQPLRLDAGTPEQECDDYLLEKFADHWRLSSVRFDHGHKPYWFSLYRVDKKIANNADIESAHHDLYHADHVPIRSDKLLYSSVSYRKRKFACWPA